MQLHFKCPEGCQLGFMHVSSSKLETLRNLRVRCKNNQCRMLVRYEQIKNHYKTCAHSKCYCAYHPNCTQQITLRDF